MFNKLEKDINQIWEIRESLSPKSNKKIKYALTHNYSAYPMLREAKKIVSSGKIGNIK